MNKIDRTKKKIDMYILDLIAIKEKTAFIIETIAAYESKNSLKFTNTV